MSRVCENVDGSDWARLTMNLHLLVELIELHNDMVKSIVPPDQLLVMSMKEGWDPLARFLGKKTPVKPFPRVNDAEAAETVANGIIVKCLLVWAGIFATGGAGIYAARCLIKR